MAVIITGSGSFIGRKLTSFLLNSGERVLGINRTMTAEFLGFENYSEVELDLTHYQDFSLPLNINPDTLILLAWDGTRGLDRFDSGKQLINTQQNLILVDILVRLGLKKIIIAGSQAEHQLVSNMSYHKNTNGNFDWYAYAKLNLFNELRYKYKSGVSIIHLRFYSVYGYGDYNYSLISNLFNSIDFSSEILLTCCDNDWNYIYIDDCISCIMSFIEIRSPLVDSFDIASFDTRPLKEFIIEAAEIIGLQKSRIKFCSLPDDKLIYNMSPNTTKTVSVTKWIPVTPFREGITRILKDKIEASKNR